MPTSEYFWVGESLATLLPDVPSTIEFDDIGIASAELVYSCDWDVAVPLVSAITVHPDYDFLKRKTASIQREEANMAKVSIKFEGIDPSGGGDPDEAVRTEYTLEGSSSSEPIEAHPEFEDNIAGKPSSPLNGALFVDPITGEQSDRDNGDGNDLLAGVFSKFQCVSPTPSHPKFGIKSYQEKGFVYTEVKTYSSASAASISINMNGIGTINTPPASDILPTVNSPRNWILSSCTAVIVGSGVKVTRSWMLSGRRGWDPDIY